MGKKSDKSAWTRLIWLWIRTKKQAVVKAVMNLRVAYTMRDILLAQQLLDSPKRPALHGVTYLIMLINISNFNRPQNSRTYAESNPI
jgi:hypothetical protein